MAQCEYVHVRACSLRDRAQTESMNGVKINILCTNKKKVRIWVKNKRMRQTTKNRLRFLKSCGSLQEAGEGISGGGRECGMVSAAGSSFNLHKA